MARAEEVFKLECRILSGTPKAILIEAYGERIWIPRSQLVDPEDLPEIISGGVDAEVKMTAWIAKEKGLR